ncbi:MAG: hypothetical protein ABW090_05385 [Sedimenticola sp.]
MDEAVKSRYAEIRELAYTVVESLREEAAQQGIADAGTRLAAPDEADYQLERDPLNGEHSLVGKWHDNNGGQSGMLLFHSDGTFFVEHDIVMPHPRKSRFFVEAVVAWGKGDSIKVETKLLPMPG